jgi:hypothetical protein
MIRPQEPGLLIDQDHANRKVIHFFVGGCAFKFRPSQPVADLKGAP